MQLIVVLQDPKSEQMSKAFEVYLSDEELRVLLSDWVAVVTSGRCHNPYSDGDFILDRRRIECGGWREFPPSG
jgi:hypothetical protein